jgi:kynurenine formamidase
MEEMTPGAAAAVQEIKNALRIMEIATIVLVVVVVLLVIVGYIDSANQREAIKRTATQSHVALCAFRSDVQARVVSSEQFLEDNPNGVPGISPAAIRKSLKAQRQTVDALSVLNCNEDSPAP